MQPPSDSLSLDLRVQASSAEGSAVTVEDLRTGRRETFPSLQALARTWVVLPGAAGPAASPVEGEAP